MAIQFRCQYCRQLLGIAPSRAGSVVDCPACGRSLRVPSTDGAPARPEPIQLPDGDPGFLGALAELSNLDSGNHSGESKAIQPRTAPASSSTAAPYVKPAPRATLSATAPKPRTSAAPAERRVATAEAGLLATMPADVLQSLAQLSPAEDLAPAIIPELTEPELLDDDADTPVAATDDEPSAAPVIPAQAGNQDQVPLSLSTAPTRDSELKAALQELADQAAAPIVGPTATHPNRPTASRLMLIGICSGIAALSLLGAYQLGRWSSHKQSRAASSGAETVHQARDVIEAATEAPLASTPSSVTGTVRYRDDAGQLQPDTDAIVVLMPARKQADLRFDARALRGNETDTGYRAIAAALSVLGAAVTRTDANGHFTLERQHHDAHVVVIVSQHLSRPGDQDVPESVTQLLTEWFDSPHHLVGRLQAQRIVIPDGTSTAALDVSFPGDVTTDR